MTDPLASPDTETTQVAFAGMYDGDYVMLDLIERSPELAQAVLHLYALVQPSTRPVRFRGQAGEVTLQRPHRGITSQIAESVIVSVRDGRVVGFRRDAPD